MKLNVKDLINVGLFAVIYFVLFVICGMLGYIPIFAILIPLMLGILGGIPVVLFIIKEQKFGAMTLLGLVSGLLAMVMGQTWMSILFGAGFGLIADFIMKGGDYKSWAKNRLGYAVFTLWSVGTMLPMWIMRDSYFASYRASGATDEYIDAIMNLTPNYMLVVVIILGFIGGLIGACLGKAVLKKHFEKAGIA